MTKCSVNAYVKDMSGTRPTQPPPQRTPDTFAALAPLAGCYTKVSNSDITDTPKIEFNRCPAYS